MRAPTPLRARLLWLFALPLLCCGLQAGAQGHVHDWKEHTGLAASLRQAGREAQTEVYKWTPFGKRFIDIEVSRNGRVMGGIETKWGNSRYGHRQRAKTGIWSILSDTK